MGSEKTQHILIMDIGKTHVKLHVLNDENFHSEYSLQMGNKVVQGEFYPNADVDAIWNWLCTSVKAISDRYLIKKVTITTHGATAALINRNSIGNGLVLPVLDYEYEAVYTHSDYQKVRPEFSCTFSPNLPAGLNLGRQLFWLKQQFPQQFESATDILMYPQYWSWRLTGQRYSEITSLGCHTDLWSLKSNDFSTLVEQLNCRDKFPELKPAWHSCGVVQKPLAAELGLPEDCEVFSGLHDSNASYLRYLISQSGKPFTVVSTGTWTILMASQVPLDNLDSTKDMLANIDALGNPIACARFMGGREFEAICEQAGSWLGEQFDQNHLQQVINLNVFALPDFSGGSGPFGGVKSGFSGDVSKISGIALATLYCALMIDYQLDKLSAIGDVYIEGAFLKNPLLCGIVDQLRTTQRVHLSLDSTGTVQGAAYLTRWGEVFGPVETSEVTSTELTGLKEYKKMWLALVEN